MSRAALELERAVKEMRAKAEKERKKQGQKAGRRPAREADVDQLEQNRPDAENQLTGDSNSGMTDATDLSQQEEQGAEAMTPLAPDVNTAEGKKKPAMAKKANGGAKKAASKPKAAKTAKADGAPKERKPREKKVASGKLKKVEASGTTYLTLEFEEGSITLTPTGNREQNRDIAVKALKALV